MRQARGIVLIGWVGFLSLLGFGGWSDKPAVTGQVVGQDGPLPGAEVRWQGSAHAVPCGKNGNFRIHRPGQGFPALTAWKEGYRIGVGMPGKRALSLISLPSEDNPAYIWLSPDPEPHNPLACAHCHQTIYEEWAGSAHARAAVNPHVLGLIGGTDARGELLPTWNVKVENPLGVGVCSRCHAPTFESPDLDYDLEKVQGVPARGVHCDLCHKVADVPTDKLGTRFGIDGLTLLRPRDGDQLFYGPLKDAVRPGESFGYFPVYQESRFCASCHEGTIFGVKVYATYSEWLESPAKERGVTCQNCHMAPTGKMTNIAPAKGGIERGPHTLASHGMPGGNVAMLKRSVRGEVAFDPSSEGLGVRVTLTAEKVGHRVPTGFIDRHLLLLVQAWDEEGRELLSAAGPRLPSRLSDPWAGKAGWVFGRWLEDEEGKGPLPFWVPTAKETDTRLHPEKVDVRGFRFTGKVERVRVRLVYRKFWPEAARARGWENEIVVWDRRFTKREGWGKFAGG